MKSKFQGLMKDRKQNETQENISVALLLEDIEDSKRVSEVFREMDIIPHFYENLKDYWQGVLTKMPSLSIVDVKLMSDGERLLRNHPYVKTNQLPLCFFYSDENAPLIYSTFEILNYGLIRKETNLRGQIKGALRRYNHTLEVNAKEKDYEIQMQKMERQVTTLITAQEKLKEEEYFKNYLDSIISRFENKRDSRDIYDAISVVFKSVREIKQWGLLELSSNGQRLVSPSVDDEKFLSIPSLWLGQPCREGIQGFAQNLASQVGVDLMGGELMSLMIKGKHELPDKILLLKCENETFLNHFEWEGLERYLSGLNAMFSLRETNVEASLGKLVNPYELFQIMDKHNFDTGVEEEGKHLITVDFSEMIQYIRTKPAIRFYWNDFFRDFLYRFENQYKLSLRVTAFNVGFVGVLVENDIKEKAFRALKAFSSRYPYWKYFDGVDIVMVRDMPPKIKMIHYSTDAVFTMMDGQDLYTVPTKLERENSLRSSQEAFHAESNPMSATQRQRIDTEEEMKNNISELAGNLKKGFFLNFEQKSDL